MDDVVRPVEHMNDITRELLFGIEQVANNDFYQRPRKVSPAHLFDDLLNDLETIGLLDDPPALDEHYELSSRGRQAVEAFLRALRPISQRCFEDPSVTFDEVLQSTAWKNLRTEAMSAMTVFDEEGLRRGGP